MNGITTIIAWIILEILSGMVDYAFFSQMVATITIVLSIHQYAELALLLPQKFQQEPTC